VTRMGKAAVQWALDHTSWTPSGMCQQFTRMSFGVGSGFPTAAAAWNGARKKHPTNDPMSVPPGVPVYYRGGSRGYGHACVSLGRGLVRSTDWPSRYRVGTARITDLERSWGQTFVGWTEDINGVTVYVDKRKKSKPETPNITAALKAKTVEGREKALRQVVRSGDRQAVEVAREYLKTIEIAEKNAARQKTLRERLRKLEVR
jgi:hypothetical protein